MSHKIGPDTRVTLHFAIKLEDGSVVDSNFDKAPATFEVGDGNLLPGFEQALFGLEAGVRKEIILSPEQGFGMPNPNNIQQMSKQDFDSQVELQPGLMLSFADANRAELPGMIKSIEGDRVEVDFNHPLAGKTLLFDVHIIEVVLPGS